MDNDSSLDNLDSLESFLVVVVVVVVENCSIPQISIDRSSRENLDQKVQYDVGSELGFTPL